MLWLLLFCVVLVLAVLVAASGIYLHRCSRQGFGTWIPHQVSQASFGNVITWTLLSLLQGSMVVVDYAGIYLVCSSTSASQGGVVAVDLDIHMLCAH